MKGIIVYKGKYGATQQYAEWLSRELKIPVVDIDEISADDITSYDYIIVGSSVYVGKLLAKTWIAKHRELLEQIDTTFYVVCATPSSEKEKINQIINNNIPSSLLKDNHIHILPGKMQMKKLSWFDRIVLKMGASMQKDPAEKARMLRDFDEVKPINLKPLLDHIKACTGKSTACTGNCKKCTTLTVNT